MPSPTPTNGKGGTNDNNNSNSVTDKGVDLMCRDIHDEPVKIRYLYTKEIASNGVYGKMLHGKLYNYNDKDKGWMDVAVKKVLIRLKHGEPRSSVVELRELTLLQSLAQPTRKHPNVIELLFSQEVLGNEQILLTLYFPFVSQTLERLVNDLAKEKNFLDAKLYAWQLFAALHHLEKEHIIHRDIKPQNLLICPKNGRLYVADFGSAKYEWPISPKLNSYYAVTRHYRPPELLLASVEYTSLADLWSAGVVLAELFFGRPDPMEQRFMAGDKTLHQLQLIYKLIGPPSRADLKAMRARKFHPCEEALVPSRPLDVLTAKFKDRGIADCHNPAPFLERIFRYNPTERLHGRALLNHPFFDVLFESGKQRHGGALVSYSGISRADLL